MYSCDTYIVESVNRVSKHCCRDRRFFRDGNIGCPCGDDQNVSARCVRSLWLVCRDDAGRFVKTGSVSASLDRLEVIGRSARRQQRLRALKNACGDFGNLMRSFSLTEDHFRKSLAQLAMMVD